MNRLLALGALATFCLMPLSAHAGLTDPLSAANGYADSGNHAYRVLAVEQAATSIANTGTQQTPGDDGTVDATVGFDFNFFGVDYSSVQINGNGHVYLGTGYDPAANYINGADDNTAHPEDNGGSIHTNYNGPRIDFWWDDLDSGSSGAVFSETRGAPGSQEFVVEFDSVPPYDNSMTTTVQMVLHEGTNDVTFNYIDQTPGTSRNGLAIGIQGSDTSYLQYGWFTNGRAEPLPDDGTPGVGESLLWTAQIPEPSSFVLLAIAGLGLILFGKRQTR
jgi:hypothetical protein